MESVEGVHAFSLPSPPPSFSPSIVLCCLHNKSFLRCNRKHIGHAANRERRSHRMALALSNLSEQPAPAPPPLFLSSLPHSLCCRINNSKLCIAQSCKRSAALHTLFSLSYLDNFRISELQSLPLNLGNPSLLHTHTHTA